MIFPARWSEVPEHARVIDPAGNVFHVLRPVFPGVAQLRDKAGNVHQLAVDPNARVPRIYDLEDSALDCLRRHFNIEYLKEG